MQVTINGEKRDLSENLTVSEMLKDLALPGERIAVELNRNIVRKKDWETVFVKNDDKIEIVHFVGGG